MGDNKSPCHRRLHDFEMFDEVRIDIVPRYKTSGLSGDEWRQSARVRVYFKGAEIAERYWSRFEYAVHALGGWLLDLGDEGMSDAAIALDRVKCDQPSCQNDAVSRYRLKRLTDRQGAYLAESEHFAAYYRQFCKKHLRRGDCSREDADDNYEVIEGPGPDGSTNLEESPAAQIPVSVNSLDELPAKIREVTGRTPTGSEGG